VSGEAGSARLVATLGTAGLLSGLAIVGTHQATLSRIAENEARALRAAIFEVSPAARACRPLEESGGEVFATYDDAGVFVAWAIRGEGPGFQDTIGLLFGFDPADGEVVGMRILESRETPGLGDRIYKDPEFVGAFRSLAARPEIRLVPKGVANAPNEVDGITGATISSKAVVKILNASLDRWAPLLPPSGEEPVLVVPAEPEA